MYRRDPAAFTSLAQQYRSEFITAGRAPHRLSRVAQTRGHDLPQLRRYPRSMAANGWSRRLTGPIISATACASLPIRRPIWSSFQQASPSALGALTYIAFETRRLFEQMHRPGRSSARCRSLRWWNRRTSRRSPASGKAISHCSGHVFDIDYSGLPPAELECLRFVLNDLGWNGYLGFVEEGRDNLHIGCSPTSRDFFTTVFEEAAGRRRKSRYSGKRRRHNAAQRTSSHYNKW